MRKPKLKVYLLEAKVGTKNAAGISPWRPPFNVVYGMVVVAESEEAARSLAMEAGADERTSIQPTKPWLDAKYTTCVEVDPKSYDGPKALVVDKREYHILSMR